MVGSKAFRILLILISFLFLGLSVVILIVDRRDYQQQALIFPEGSQISDVPLGGLSYEQAMQRLNMAFSQPVELRYQDARMQFFPSELGFSLNIEESLGQLEDALKHSGYWQHMWGKKKVEPVSGEVKASLDEAKLSKFLTGVVHNRYDQPATATVPILYTTNFKAGQGGIRMDVETAIPLIRTGLFSAFERIINLPVNTSPPLSLELQNLEIFLKQIITLEGYDGLIEVYLNDLSSDQEIHLALNNQQSVQKDVAYSAASTIKIPIMVSTLLRQGEPIDDTVQNLLERMITLSENPPADRLMGDFIDPTRGPILITDDLQKLGYVNTFLAGFFAPGSPLLALYKTPANTRNDIFLDPDVYNQTVPSEIGDLLSQIYWCANPDTGTSLFNKIFNDSISQRECQNMLNLLGQNKIGILMEAGLPPNASVAHKHGWTPELDNLLHSISDVGIVSTNGGDYVLVMFMHTKDQLIFDEGNWLFAKLSQTIYNAFNVDNQAYWWIE